MALSYGREMPDSGITDPIGEDAVMSFIRHAVHDAAVLAALFGGAALSMLVAKGAADAVVYVGTLAMR